MDCGEVVQVSISFVHPAIYSAFGDVELGSDELPIILSSLSLPNISERFGVEIPEPKPLIKEVS